jgi:hypothetical protein
VQSMELRPPVPAQRALTLLYLSLVAAASASPPSPCRLRPSLAQLSGTPAGGTTQHAAQRGPHRGGRGKRRARSSLIRAAGVHRRVPTAAFSALTTDAVVNFSLSFALSAALAPVRSCGCTRHSCQPARPVVPSDTCPECHRPFRRSRKGKRDTPAARQHRHHICSSSSISNSRNQPRRRTRRRCLLPPPAAPLSSVRASALCWPPRLRWRSARTTRAISRWRSAYSIPSA